MKPNFFRSPLHCSRLANDGLLYACDRGNNRVQIFKASDAGGGDAIIRVFDYSDKGQLCPTLPRLSPKTIAR